MYRLLVAFSALVLLTCSAVAADPWQELTVQTNCWNMNTPCQCEEGEQCLCTPGGCFCGVTWQAFNDGDISCVALMAGAKQIGAYRFRDQQLFILKDGSMVKWEMPKTLKPPVQVQLLTSWAYTCTKTGAAAASVQAVDTTYEVPATLQYMTMNADGSVTTADVQASTATTRVGPIRRLFQRIRSRRLLGGGCG